MTALFYPQSHHPLYPTLSLSLNPQQPHTFTSFHTFSKLFLLVLRTVAISCNLRFAHLHCRETLLRQHQFAKGLGSYISPAAPPIDRHRGYRTGGSPLLNGFPHVRSTHIWASAKHTLLSTTFQTENSPPFGSLIHIRNVEKPIIAQRSSGTPQSIVYSTTSTYIPFDDYSKRQAVFSPPDQQTSPSWQLLRSFSLTTHPSLLLHVRPILLRRISRYHSLITRKDAVNISFYPHHQDL